ncbi:MAG: glycosyltransferase family 1 protein [Chloroflexaceae bacterium]|nr:glycosyltransferase family 1 protein [Chloroflexaceae bacterium]
MLSVHSSPLARLGSKEAGGMNVYVRELSRELGHQGVSVDIFTRRSDPSTPTIVPLAPGVRVVHGQMGPAAPYDKNLLVHYGPAFVEDILRFAESQGVQYDIIHSHYWVSGEVAVVLRQSWRCPVVQMFHTLGAMKNRVARSAEETETSRRIAVERMLLREADAVVAATPLDREHMVHSYGADAGRIHTIPGGVEVRRFRPVPRSVARERLGLPLGQQLVLGVGRMEPLKGLDMLIRALAMLHARHPSWRGSLRGILIGGHAETTSRDQWNTEQQRLDALRQEHGLASAVSFLGTQPHELMPDYYAAADVVAVPSLYESFGLVALEAMACGAPVVASQVGGLSLLIEHERSGLLVPPNDPAMLAEQIAVLLTQDAVREAISAGAHQRAQSYRWSRVAHEIQSLYCALG